MRTNKQTPLLEEIRIMLEAATFHLSEGNLLDVEDLLRDAIGDVYEAIAQIQGAREDAHRMAGRVTLDTELLDMLAPEGDIEPPTAEEIMQGHTPLRDAYGRLWMLDKNGACCVATDIVDAWHEGGHDATYRRIAAEIHEACDRMLAEEKEGN
jgi:hypothetical protein